MAFNIASIAGRRKRYYRKSWWDRSHHFHRGGYYWR
jgi:hypothetical protein